MASLQSIVVTTIIALFLIALFVPAALVVNLSDPSHLAPTSSASSNNRSEIPPSPAGAAAKTPEEQLNSSVPAPSAAPSSAIEPAPGAAQFEPGFSIQDLELINQTAQAQIRYVLSLQLPNGAIPQSNDGDGVVFTRDMSLAAYTLVLLGRAAEAEPTIDFLLSLPQGSSSFARPSGVPSSPNAWYQEYTTSGQTLEQSLRGEDQGMALLALTSYILSSRNYTLAREFWPKIESSANFIVYLQQTPGPGMPVTGLYRHGDNWHDTRPENTDGNGAIYWPYWPEYYHWEEENMRMIVGMRGAVSLATDLGYTSDAREWNMSLTLAQVGLANESVYNKYETYDYFGSVLWGLQSDPNQAKHIVGSIPTDLISSFGIKDLASDNHLAASDTIDYMTCLVGVGDISAASHYLHAIVGNYSIPTGGFDDTLNLNGTPQNRTPMVYASARFLYFDYIVTTLG